MKALSANHPLTREACALGAQQPVLHCAAGVRHGRRERCHAVIPDLGIFYLWTSNTNFIELNEPRSQLRVVNESHTNKHISTVYYYNTPT